MKLVILVDELKYPPGIYGYKPLDISEIEKPIEGKLKSALSILSSTLGISSGALTLGTAIRIGATTLGRFTPLGMGISGAMLAGALAKGSYDIFKNNQEAKIGVWGLQQFITDETPKFLQYINSSIIMHYDSIAENYKDAYKKTEFYGAFKNTKQMKKILEADGSNSEIIITSVNSAKEYFEHIGQGLFSPGKYLFHPKKLNVLVPFENYYSIILRELDEEFLRFFSSLGAKKITIQTMEGVSIDGSAIVPSRGKAKASYKKIENADKVYEFYPQVIDPDSALKNKVWIQDFPKMQTFFETRKSFRLKYFEETINIDTSFDIDMDILFQFTGKFDWNKTSSYRYEVEFYSEKELSEAN